MALAAIVDTLDAVPEPFRKEYVPKDGKFVLDLTGTLPGFVPAADLAAANTKIVEFRDNNIKLTQERDALSPLKEQFKDLDPVAARAALQKVKDLEKKGVKDGDDITALVKAAIEPLTAEIATLKQTTIDERKRADEAVFKTAISDVFIAAGGEPTAVDFIVGKAKQTFVIDNGMVKAIATAFSADRPGEPLSVKEWLTQQTKDAAFAFKTSNGSGARNSDGTNAPANLRPGVVVIKNPTPQQLGSLSKDVAAGKVRFEFTEAQ